MVTKLRKLNLLICLVMAFDAGFARSVVPVSNGTAWVLDYAGDSANSFIWDKRTARLIDSRVPAMISGNVRSNLGGPPSPFVVLGHRYTSTSACRPHSCLDKGFFWIDTLTGRGLGASIVADMATYLSPAFIVPSTPTILKLGSNSFGPSQLPAEAKQALIDWLSDENIHVDRVEFFQGNFAPVIVNDAELTARPTFAPPTGGPAFDCAFAHNDVERTICGDYSLAAHDLALSKVYSGMRLGSSTQDAREQLQKLQRRWLQQRDRTCTAAADLPACLAMQYDAQRNVLDNWVPVALPRPLPH